MALVTGYAVPQSDPPRPPRETLPTMYDLPSEWPEEPGLPDVGASPSRDVFHDLQPQLLSRTLTLVDYGRDRWFAGSDLNVYYNVHHPLWHKRPDWFLAVGVPRLYEQRDMRHSYVTWQEGQNPYVVIELLSPGTEAEDLGRFYGRGDRGSAPTLISQPMAPNGKGTAVPPSAESAPQRPPGKFVVYEQYLRVPHYVTYNRKTRQLRYFQLNGGRYQEHPLAPTSPQIWLEDLQVGLGIWQGCFEGIPSGWLRWCDQEGHWLLTDTEQAEQAQVQERQAKEQERQAKEQERQAKEQERQAKEQAQAQVLQAARNLLATGMTLPQVVALLQLSPDQAQALEGES